MLTEPAECYPSDPRGLWRKFGSGRRQVPEVELGCGVLDLGAAGLRFRLSRGCPQKLSPVWSAESGARIPALSGIERPVIALRYIVKSCGFHGVGVDQWIE